MKDVSPVHVSLPILDEELLVAVYRFFESLGDDLYLVVEARNRVRELGAGHGGGERGVVKE